MIQSRIAEMSALVETMRLYNYHALASMNDLPTGQGGRGEVHRIAATSVMYCADSLNRVLDHAAQIHGGVAYIWETEINRLYRGIKLLEIGAGTTEVRKPHHRRGTAEGVGEPGGVGSSMGGYPVGDRGAARWGSSRNRSGNTIVPRTATSVACARRPRDTRFPVAPTPVRSLRGDQSPPRLSRPHGIGARA